MIITNDDGIATQSRLLRNLGRDDSGLSQLIGFNRRMDDIQACFMSARLKGLDAEIEERQKLASKYDAGLAEVTDKLILAELAHFNQSERPVIYVYQIQVDRRDQLAEYLAVHNIQTETYYPRALHLQPCVEHMGLKQGDMPVAECVSDKAIALPLYPGMTDEHIEYVCKTIINFYQ
jgi:dTDP-4-amino-4,6-dideoxygalactose transaminase